MNILYISYLNGDSWAGPTYSVPKQIEAQSLMDSVFWYNIRETKEKKWKECIYYHDLEDYPNQTISDLPAPFNKPDIIVIEQFYGFAGQKIINRIMNCSIPYIIIPRGELTASAQKRKAFKKLIGNALFFHRFSSKAATIEYLTEQEKIDSGDKWNKNSIIIPNGISFPKRTKDVYCLSGIRCIAIGRIEPYHKGLDMLIQACGMISKEMREAKCRIDLYGPDYDGKVAFLNEEIQDLRIGDIIEIHDGLYGAEKEQALLKSDVYLLTSRFEGHPMALIEAFSYGLPCVITRGSNMKEEVDQYNAGWTAENDTLSIRDALLRMIRNRALIPDMGKNSLSLAKVYEWSSIAKSTHQLYQKYIH